MKFSRIQRRRRQAGFTLLELLVVVAILAAVAGTATIALQDTDARASAAAHVAMMDELNKGIRTFRVLNNNAYPNNYDSLLEWGGTGTPVALTRAGFEAADVQPYTPPAATTAGDLSNVMLERLSDIGITNMRIANTTLNPDGDGDCSNMQGLINSRGNAVVAGNIYLSPAANGCGENYVFSTATPVDHINAPIMVWTGGTERITGVETTNDIDIADFTNTDADVPLFMVVGLGPSTTLFDVANLGGMTTVPVYRHVGDDQYNRFLALFHIATTDGTATPVPVDQVLLQAIVDGAGDTKEEELGEWDGTRNTI